MGKTYGFERQARILVVDGERVFALAFSAILKDQGYEVATAFSGEEAVAMAPGHSPDLLVTGVQLGAMGGVEVASYVTELLPGCKVLFLSAAASVYEVSDAAPQRLVYSFMSKAVHPLDFLNAIAYMASAANTAEDPAGTAAEYDPVRRSGRSRWSVEPVHFHPGETSWQAQRFASASALN
jgi:DNA-binding NtrC family response regulator